MSDSQRIAADALSYANISEPSLQRPRFRSEIQLAEIQLACIISLPQPIHPK